MSTPGSGSTITDSKELLILSLARFFKDPAHFKVFLDHTAPPPADGGGAAAPARTSLRIIDWFVTNFAKTRGTIIVRADDAGNVAHFNVYLSYRSQLKAYSKHQFDPFRRRYRINYYYDADRFVETTIGQLNFFKWLIDHDILPYIAEHHDAIEADMIAAQKQHRDSASKVVAEKPSQQQQPPAATPPHVHHYNMNLLHGQRTVEFA